MQVGIFARIVIAITAEGRMRAANASVKRSLGGGVIVVLALLLAKCALTSSESVATSSGALAAQATLADLQTRFHRRVELAPQRGDADLLNPKIEHRAVLGDNSQNALVNKAGAFFGPSEGLATLPALADGTLTLRNGSLSVEVRLAGAQSVPGFAASGYLVYPAAAPDTVGAVLVRADATTVEDYVVFESTPGVAEVSYMIHLSPTVAGLRLVANVLEFLDRSGVPRLRARSPYLVDSQERTITPSVSLSGCVVDGSGASPYERPVISPDATDCVMHVSWKGAVVTYPAILDPGWGSTGAMVEPRTGHAAVTITVGGSSDDKVMVIGGLGGNGFPVGAEIYDPITNTWAIANTPNFKRSEHVAARLTNGKVLVTAGTTPGSFYLPDSEIYDPSTGNWSNTGSLNTARRSPSLHVLPSGKVLVAGGAIQATGDYTNTAEVYDPATGLWSNTGSMSAARGQFAMTMLKNGKVLAPGGAASMFGPTNLASAESYDATIGTWAAAGTMTTARAQAAVARIAYNQKVIVAGGSTSGTSAATATADLYDPTSNTWSAGASMATGRVAPAFVALPDSRLLVAGGSDTSGPLTSAEIYVPSSKSWVADSVLSQPRIGVPATGFYSKGMWQVLITGLAVSGSTTGDVRAPDEPAGEAKSAYAVNVDWSNPTFNGSFASSATIAGSAKNTSAASLSVQIFTRAFGLDQRTVRRSVNTFTIPAGGTQNFNVTINTIPIQSVGMQSELQLEAQYTPAGGTAITVVSPPLFYSFASGFGTATFTGWSTSDDTITTPLGTGTPFSRALESVRASSAATHTFMGRFWNGSAFTTYSASSSVTKGTYHFRGPRHVEWDENYPTPSGSGLISPAPGTVKVCTKWRAQFGDGGRGETYGNTNAPFDYTASRTRFLVTGTAANAPISFTDFLGPDGCTGYMTLTPGNYLFVQDAYFRNGAYINVIYGGWDPRWVSAPANGIPSSADPNYAGSAELFAPWTASFATGFTVPTGANGNVINLAPSYTDMAVRAAAAASLIVEMPDNSLAGPTGTVTPTYTLIANKVCPNNPGPNNEPPAVKPTAEACGGSDLKVYLGPSLDGKSHTTQSKFTIAHETGHSVQQFSVGPPYYKYGIDPINPAACKCDHIPQDGGSNAIHCLQSRQQFGATQLEGYAQFYSSRVWNDFNGASCVFTYYKPFRDDDGGVTFPPLAKSCKNSVGLNPKWMVNHCDTAGQGVEWDWLLFFYAINTGSGTDRTTGTDLSNIWRTACTGGTSTVCRYYISGQPGDILSWNGSQGIRGGAFAYYGGSLDPRFLRFTNTAADTGIDR